MSEEAISRRLISLVAFSDKSNQLSGAFGLYSGRLG